MTFTDIRDGHLENKISRDKKKLQKTNKARSI